MSGRVVEPSPTSQSDAREPSAVAVVMSSPPSRAGYANIKLTPGEPIRQSAVFMACFKNGVWLPSRAWGRQTLRLTTRWISRARSTRTWFHSVARMADSGLDGGFAA